MDDLWSPSSDTQFARGAVLLLLRHSCVMPTSILLKPNVLDSHPRNVARDRPKGIAHEHNFLATMLIHELAHFPRPQSRSRPTLGQ